MTRRITETAGTGRTHSSSFVEVNLELIAQNLAALKARTTKKIFGVLKADAYGLGAVPVARRLADEADFFALATVSEARTLRTAGVTTPLLVFGYVATADIAWMIDHDVRPALSTVEAARAWEDVAAERHKVAPIHLAIDTGHHRVGIDWTGAEALDVVRDIAVLPHLRIEGAYSHFATADEAPFPHVFAQEQLRRFQTAMDDMARAGIDIPYRHIANDAALLTFDEASLFDAVRLGICLYGSYPSMEVAQQTDLTLAVPYRWLAPVSRVETIATGESVSYGRTFVAERPTRVATVQVGYADGYPRLLSNRGVMLVGDVPCPVIGRVCMDQTMLDVTDAPTVDVGDLVLVLGARDWSCAQALAEDSRTGRAPENTATAWHSAREGLDDRERTTLPDAPTRSVAAGNGERRHAPHGISAEYLAGLCDTISYEMTTNWHPRVERVYVGGEDAERNGYATHGHCGNQLG